MKMFFKRLLSHLPIKLPVGMTEFDTWSASIIELSGKFADEDSMKFALASMLIHAGPSKKSQYQTQPGRLPKDHFVQGLRKSAANQVASQVFQDVKAKQEAAKLQAQTEVTVTETVTDDQKS